MGDSLKPFLKLVHINNTTGEYVRQVFARDDVIALRIRQVSNIRIWLVEDLFESQEAIYLEHPITVTISIT